MYSMPSSWLPKRTPVFTVTAVSDSSIHTQAQCFELTSTVTIEHVTVIKSRAELSSY